jgi:hypothetical protein
MTGDDGIHFDLLSVADSQSEFDFNGVDLSSSHNAGDWNTASADLLSSILGMDYQASDGGFGDVDLDPMFSQPALAPEDSYCALQNRPGRRRPAGTLPPLAIPNATGQFDLDMNNLGGDMFSPFNLPLLSATGEEQAGMMAAEELESLLSAMGPAPQLESGFGSEDQGIADPPTARKMR